MTCCLFLIMLLMNADILMRFLFSAPIDGVTEIVELSIAGIVFLQLSDAGRAGPLPWGPLPWGPLPWVRQPTAVHLAARREWQAWQHDDPLRHHERRQPFAELPP